MTTTPDSVDALQCEVNPRALEYPLRDYHNAPSCGPLNAIWRDKPHRIVYDLIAAVRYYAARAATQVAAGASVDVVNPRYLAGGPMAEALQCLHDFRQAISAPGSAYMRASHAEGQQARAALSAPQGAQPVGEVYTMEELVPGGGVKCHVSLRAPLPAGTLLYTAPPSQQGAAVAVEPDMRAICEALGFDPTNHHNAEKCSYCRPAGVAQQAPTAVAVLDDARDAKRYRWLARKVGAHGVIDGWAFAFPTHLTLPAPCLAMKDPEAALAQTIDAAIAAQEGGGHDNLR